MHTAADVIISEKKLLYDDLDCGIYVLDVFRDYMK